MILYQSKNLFSPAGKPHHNSRLVDSGQRKDRRLRNRALLGQARRCITTCGVGGQEDGPARAVAASVCHHVSAAKKRSLPASASGRQHAGHAGPCRARPQKLNLGPASGSNSQHAAARHWHICLATLNFLPPRPDGTMGGEARQLAWDACAERPTRGGAALIRGHPAPLELDCCSKPQMCSRGLPGRVTGFENTPISGRIAIPLLNATSPSSKG